MVPIFGKSDPESSNFLFQVPNADNTPGQDGIS